jgi:uncharacterized membrane protein YozB (DUF420 family)
VYYTPILNIHSWLRWATLLLAIAATVNAFRPDPDLSKRMPGRQWDTLFMMALDFQVLFGLLLYFGLSPFTMQAFKDFGGAVQNGPLRFWAIDHIGWMAAATVLVRIGRVLALGAATAQARRKWRALFFTLTTLTILAGIPWPGLSYGRPLFRFW